ncbi:MAG TPA: serine hydrolase [Chitinophagaceae bacterium]|nr:serine hydrolase [Chitinophagaceae bacterium]
MKKLLFLLLLPLAVSAQKDYSKLAEQYMQAQAKVNHFSGAVLIMKQNKPLLRQAYGMADMEWNIPNTSGTKFRIGSITKQFTAACILQLVEQNKLSPDDKLSKFFPGFPKGDSVTIQMLLDHTSGIANYTDIPGFDKVFRLSWNKDSIIAFFENRPYNFSPGTKFSYTNSGFFLLGCIIEKVSGQSYNDYLRQHILDKLGMTNTGVDKLDSILPFRAKGYSKRNGHYVNAEFISMKWPFSAGSIYSTPGDLYKWDRALYGNAILSDASKKKMFTPNLSHYGYGIIIDSFENHLRIWHNGGIPGFLSHFTRFPDDDICIILLSNNESNVDLIDAGLSDILYDNPVIIPYEHKEVKIDPALLDRYVGKYSAFMTLEFFKKDGKLYRHLNGTADIQLIPESETKFFYADGSDRQIEFEVDKTGKVIKTWFINNGLKGEMKKIE